MRRMTASLCVLNALMTFEVVCPLVSAAPTVVVDYTDRGWYRPTGHLTNNLNYFVGDNLSNKDTRNFFVFNLAGVTQPIASATLALYVPGAPGDIGPGYESPDPSETYELHDVVTPIASLVGNTGGVAAYNDLGSGVVYGSRTMTAADNGSVVEISLNPSAIAALNSSDGLFGIGGSITTLDELMNSEHTFAYTEADTNVAQLRLTLVPEPSALALLGLGVIGLFGYRQRKS